MEKYSMKTNEIAIKSLVRPLTDRSPKRDPVVKEKISSFFLMVECVFI
ncbi:conserved hypothetical protein [delta proteobacterium NaphS2]|nr:conserved hypothetical protein [delta proteobacterium NaphS2]